MGSSESLISNFLDSAESTLTVTRYAAGGYTNGVWADGATSTLTVQMSVQPFNGKDLLALSEGERTKRGMKGYCDTELLTADKSAAKKADRVSYNDTVFEIQKVERWRGDLDHYKIVMFEVNI